jgi:hypothetical protein
MREVFGERGWNRSQGTGLQRQFIHERRARIMGSCDLAAYALVHLGDYGSLASSVNKIFHPYLITKFQ